MSDEEVENHPDFCRGMWMLNRQMDSVDDFIHLWLLFGPWRGRYPKVERTNPWFQGFEYLLPN